jgi:hypothetical protein
LASLHVWLAVRRLEECSQLHVKIVDMWLRAAIKSARTAKISYDEKDSLE